MPKKSPPSSSPSSSSSSSSSDKTVAEKSSASTRDVVKIATAALTEDTTTHNPLDEKKSEEPDSPDSVLQKVTQTVRRSRRIAEKTKAKKELEIKLHDERETNVGSDKKLSKDAKEQKEEVEEKQHKLETIVETAVTQLQGNQKPASNPLPDGDLSSESSEGKDSGAKNAIQRHPAAITEGNIEYLSTDFNLGESSGAVQSSEHTQFKPSEEPAEELTDVHSLKKAMKKKDQAHKEELQRKDKKIEGLKSDVEKYKQGMERMDSQLKKLRNVISEKNQIIDQCVAVIQQNQDAGQVPNRTDASSQSSSACSTKAPPSNPEN